MVRWAQRTLGVRARRHLRSPLHLHLSHGISGTTGLHPYYQDLIANLPPGVELTNADQFNNAYWKKDGFKDERASMLTAIAKIIVDTIGLPNLWPVKSDADLLYCCQHLPLSKKRWILDIDHPSALVRYTHSAQRAFLARTLTKSAVEKSRCRGIVFWSQAAQDAFCAMIPTLSDAAKKKMRIIPPSMPWRGDERRRHRGYRLLFIANIFYQKGGPDALEAFARYHRTDPSATLTVISQVPDELKRRYGKRGSGIIFKDRMPREQLFEEYRHADVFLYPTRMDIFGLVVLEALSFGLPVITTRDFCTAELVEHQKTGLLVKRSVPDWFDGRGLMAFGCDVKSDEYQRLIHARDETLLRSLEEAIRSLADPDVRERMHVALKGSLARYTAARRRLALSRLFGGVR